MLRHKTSLESIEHKAVKCRPVYGIEQATGELLKRTETEQSRRARYNRHTIMTTLYIQTLGQFKVLRDGEPIPDNGWGTHRAKLLLKFLITQYGESIVRDQIMEALWPEASIKSASRDLYTAVSDL